MYNRYVPQPDGTYRRNSVQDSPPPRPVQQREAPRRQEPVPPPCALEQEVPSCQKGQPCTHMRHAYHPSSPPHKQNKTVTPMGVGSFFRQLLPKDFDTEDLIIILLLLLMAGDCREEQNSALLTMALYLFM